MNSEITHTNYLDCYIRVSTTQQKTDGHSLEFQEHLGLSIAEKLGLTVRLRNEGSQSSTIGYRDVLEELKEDISKGRVTNIWTQDRSRMFRDQIDGYPPDMTTRKTLFPSIQGLFRGYRTI